ncbi:uncharacterized protein LOC135347458 [Halichondria panicea]|uniref:uncharacterized protein LOC135347458 n=1 Tax=Halichondria panicea TaxID=6063 RepID=UPI00312B8058
MHQVQLTIVFYLLAVSMAQGDDGNCKASVVVMSKEEISREIQSQITRVLTKGSITPSVIVNNENVTFIVQREIDKLFEKVKNLIQPIVTELATLLKPGRSPSHPASTCKAILNQDKTSPSDFYWLKASNGTAVKMYCDMTKTCGRVTGGWMKLADLDMTQNLSQCPEPLYQNTQHGKNLCTRRDTRAGCSEVHYPSNGIAFSEVCGRVIGYQSGSTDGPYNGHFTGAGIDTPYIDGVSLTHGHPRHHIWTFIAALDEVGDYRQGTCECTNINQRGYSPANFVGNDYFCDTGSEHKLHSLNPDDPLWDGAGCGSNNECCTFRNPPWFYKKLGKNIENNVDMRLCRDEPVTNEDVLLEKIDLYVR